mmetsp:Transcript_140729/g.366415  ORF Transcript_140729/g.366415 Transcript_140729/m.366415 type:complete len:102 (+) Transcript_140729:2-307(+)
MPSGNTMAGQPLADDVARSGVATTAQMEAIYAEAPIASSSTSTQGLASTVPKLAAEGIAARQAAEQVFENAPGQSQTWDMTASIRGISGGVKTRIDQFDNK